MAWYSYTSQREHHTVVGDLRVHPGVYSPELYNERPIYIWLPESYNHSGKRYPVVYMHDGQNLFDAHISHSGEWQVDEALTQLQHEGCEAIVVGIPNQGSLRRVEYNPHSAHVGEVFWEGRGDAYLRFITETLKPLIDSTFRTRPEAAMTGIAGSSMGGLISLHGFLTRPDVFGFCGSFSPVFWISDGLQQTIERHQPAGGKVYLDIGGKEGEVILGIAPTLAATLEDGHRFYLNGVRDLRNRLLGKGYTPGQTLLYVEDAAALHNEPAWARRLPHALRFMLPR